MSDALKHLYKFVNGVYICVQGCSLHYLACNVCPVQT
ncbi:hypothetical protein BCP18_074 [Bacillus phage BCP18]|nr:hypothetical protein BCP18_074 [Bacillus phage BCP18]